ncbi:WD domain [Trypanosoma vivax]|uniref:Uncharacterized protein n=1 Tax=Trypanosoma vivax (strain Y486) TaxID=1055687 RepID=G0U7N9_TRYVY|nr:hypothetical protein TRVL_08895 [Trypanosoma vivax]KAH8620507.1 WD domain [Trypanosoma vivax]CCC51897.1 conserved hypothetical protein [Trypanosoma vivax Y486]
MLSSNAHQPLFSLKHHSSAVITCALDELGLYPNYMLSGDVDGVVMLWDLELRAVLLSFQVVRKVHSSTKLSGEAAPPLGFSNEGVLKVGFLSFSGILGNDRENQDVHFYVQCRDRHLYIWKVSLSEDEVGGFEALEAAECKSSLVLLHTLDVPQHGFCPVSCVSLSATERQFAIPHDGDGIISLWNTVVTTSEPLSRETLQVKHVQLFSAAGAEVKCGAVMCISYRDALFLCVAFESGHVSLNSTSGKRLAIVRAFAETALRCLWSDDVLLTSSAEGRLQCYRLLFTTNSVDDSGRDCGESTPSLVIRWEVSLPKGVGSMALQRHLVVIGSWDHTLRLYDVGSGRVVTILTAHNGAVNDISLAAPAVAESVSFGYDVRHPRRSRFNNSSLRGINGERTDETRGNVYIFVSSSGDYTLAVWRIDFTILSALSVSAV